MDYKNIIESLLFAAGEPLEIKKISEILSLDDAETKNQIHTLASEYESENRGLAIILDSQKAQLVSSPQNASFIGRLIKTEFEEELSQAALETLAIIAYRGPVSKVEIENLRGVNCSFILRSLALRGLVERKENLLDRRSHIYNVSFDFLKYLGVNSLEKLPGYKDEGVIS